MACPFKKGSQHEENGKFEQQKHRIIFYNQVSSAHIEYMCR
ncbi:hypothetical protein ALTERO38_51388 [Alteromonas sp. 38]|nr:hypothetical protein ALTER154_70572 [Alteromonas sp. 154]VXB71114.1 hypothetical protein ALTERO38_51388 [Alteromonas sp. 38]